MIILIISLSAIACIMAWQMFNQIKLEVDVEELAVKVERTDDAVLFLTRLIKQTQMQKHESDHIETTSSQEQEIQSGYIEEDLEDDDKSEKVQIRTLENIKLIDVSDDEYEDDESYISDVDVDDDVDDEYEEDDKEKNTKQIDVDLSIYEPELKSSPNLSESDVKIKLVNAIVPDKTLEDDETKMSESDYKKMSVAEIRKLASLKLNVDASKYKKAQLVKMLIKPTTPPMSPLADEDDNNMFVTEDDIDCNDDNNNDDDDDIDINEDVYEDEVDIDESVDV